MREKTRRRNRESRALYEAAAEVNQLIALGILDCTGDPATARPHQVLSFRLTGDWLAKYLAHNSFSFRQMEVVARIFLQTRLGEFDTLPKPLLEVFLAFGKDLLAEQAAKGKP